jgi:hypothetical protein
MADDVDPLVPRPLDRLRNAPLVADLSVLDGRQDPRRDPAD